MLKHHFLKCSVQPDNPVIVIPVNFAVFIVQILAVYISDIVSLIRAGEADLGPMLTDIELSND